MGKVYLIISKEFRLRKIETVTFHPTDVPTSEMSEKYLYTLIKKIKYKVIKSTVTLPFRLYWYLGRKLRFRGMRYLDKVSELEQLKRQFEEIIE